MINRITSILAVVLAVASLAMFSATAVHAGNDGSKAKKGYEYKHTSNNEDEVAGVAAGDDSCAVFYAGQHAEVGSVCLTVSADRDTATVTYSMTDGWTLSNPHLWVGDSLAGVPATGSGNPIPGQFPYNADVHDVDGYTFDIPVASLNVNVDLLCSDDYTLLVGAHGEVSRNGQHESAWAGETRFTQKGKWATYFGVVPDCGDTPQEPEPQVCQVWETSVDYAGTAIVDVKPDLSRLDSNGDIQTITADQGLYVKFEIGSSNRGEEGKINAVAAVDATDPQVVITLADLFLVIDGQMAEDPMTTGYLAESTTDGEYKQGVLSYQFASSDMPAGVSAFTVLAQVEVCSIGVLEPITSE